MAEYYQYYAQQSNKTTATPPQAKQNLICPTTV
jgi:hypothetical protein